MIGNLKDFIDLVHDLLIRLGMADWLADIVSAVLAIGALISMLVYAGHWLISRLLFYNNRRRLSRDLHPFYTKAEIDKATRYYIPTKYQDTAPSQADEPSRSFIDSPKAKLIPMMLKTAFQQGDSRYYLILADSGMGKTTFMMNLFLAYKNQWWWKQKHDIRLLPLGHPQTLAEVVEIKNPEHTILLLDALDEDVEAVKDYKKRLGEILDKTWKFREVVITCRTQFFPSEVEEPSKTGYFRYGTDGGEHFFRKAYVSVFDDKDINRYLRKRFKFWQWKNRRKARRIVQKSPNLMVRPMLLSHIQDLVGEEREYEYTYQIYEVLIQKWVERESNKPGIAEKYGSRENFQKLLLEFSQALAVDIYKNRDKRGGRLSIHKDEKLNSFQNLSLIDFESIEDTWGESKLRNQSLLNRDTEGWYKYSHKSILEYYLAKEANNRSAFFYSLNFEGLSATKTFINEIVLGDVLANAETLFTSLTLKKTIPLSQVRNEDFFGSNRIISLKITNATKVNIWCLSILLKSTKKFELTLEDISNLPILYCLDIPFFIKILKIQPGNIWENRILLELWEKLMLAELRERLELVGLRILWEWLEQCERLETLERIKQREHLKWQRGILEQHEQEDKWKLYKRQKVQDDMLNQYGVELFTHLKSANEFIRQCQALEAALPNVKIYY